MTLLEMQILFHQIIEDTSPEFADSQRPDSFNILKYLNNSAVRYVEKKYLSFPTMEENIRFISENSNDLKDMIRKVRSNTFYGSDSMGDGIIPYTMPGSADYHGPYGANSSVYYMPHDFMHFIACHIKSSRPSADVLSSATAQWHECKIISHDQAKRYMTTAFNKPILREPVILFDADGFFTIIYDPEQTVPISDIQFTYLRKPDTLDFDFEWLNGNGSIVLTSSMINKRVRVRSGSVVEYPSNNVPSGGYVGGSKFLVLNGSYQLYNYDNNFDMYVGYPGDQTDELSLASYMHEDIVRMAVSMFLDEAKLKLVPKAQA